MAVWFEKNDGTVSVSTAKDFLEGLKKPGWTLKPGQEEAIKDLAFIDFDNQEGEKVPARSIEEYRAFLGKGWVPIKPSDFTYRMEVLKRLASVNG